MNSDYRVAFALSAWLVISFLLMMDRNTVRGFSIAAIGGQLILPEGARATIKLAILPNMDKLEVIAVGILLGTIVFHPYLIFRFRFQVADILLVALLGSTVASSVLNNRGFYDGFSQAFYRFATFVLPVCLARIHLRTPERLKTFLIYLVMSGVIYTMPAVWEFRMSPQIHTKLYGYFQHSFDEFYRHGFYRPVVCFPHALNLGRYFALCAFLAAFPLRKELSQKFPFGEWLFLAPLTGLAVSMSYGPYLMFVCLVGLYFVPQRYRSVGYLVPVAAFTWLALVFMGSQPLQPVVSVLDHFNAARAASFEYRLNAVREYSYVIRQEFLFGHAGWNNGRIAGLATDSNVLIDFLALGISGVLLIYGWWFWTMRTAFRLADRTSNTRFRSISRALAGVVPICLAFVVFDQALDPQIDLIAGGILAIYPLALRPRAQRRAARPPATEVFPSRDAVIPVRGFRIE